MAPRGFPPSRRYKCPPRVLPLVVDTGIDPYVPSDLPIRLDSGVDGVDLFSLACPKCDEPIYSSKKEGPWRCPKCTEEFMERLARSHDRGRTCHGERGRGG